MDNTRRLSIKINNSDTIKDILFKYNKISSLSEKINEIVPQNDLEVELDLIEKKIYLLPSCQNFDFCCE
jgi:hypothetical protein